jgi:hypothetical protein
MQISLSDKCQKLVNSFIVAILSYSQECFFRNSWVRVARIWVQDEETAPREHETGMNEPY